jgi:hypothetical protein
MERIAQGPFWPARSLIQDVAALAKTSQCIRSGIAPMSRNISATMAMMVSQVFRFSRALETPVDEELQEVS